MRGCRREDVHWTALEPLEPRLLLSGDVFITEFMAINDSCLADKFGRFPDWFELHNAGESDVHLGGWSVTDDPDDLRKWVFPSVNLPAGGYMVVFASDSDLTDPAGELHTNFKLKGEGEYLGLVRPDLGIEHEYAPRYPAQFADISYGLAQGVEEVLLSDALHTARAFVPPPVPADPLDDPLGLDGLDWIDVGFDDSAWLAAASGVGVGYENTGGYEAYIDIDVKAPMFNLRPGVYSRIAFNVDDPTALDSLKLLMKYDDGFVAYLNGTPIASAYAPADPTADDVATFHPVDINPAVFEEFDVNAHLSALTAGTNVLAIHGLNRSADSSDMLIEPKLVATRSLTHDAVTGFFATPTPGEPNGAADNSGPTVAQVTDNPPRPADDEDLVITAEVTQRFAPVDAVDLHYIVMFGSESVVPMLDDGAGWDAAAGDGIYTAVIPSTGYGPGQMVRWYVSATDANGRDSRMPMHLNPLKAPDYFGTVVFDPAADPAQIDMPVLEWFVEDMSWRTFMLTEANYYTWKQDPANWADAFLYHDGRFYSGVRVRVRGSYTLYAGGNYALRKLKFEMADGQWFQYSPDESPVEEFNIQMFYTDQADLMREPLAVDAFELAGVPTFQCFHIHLRNNGTFYGPAAFVEQMDERFLERVDLDPDGALYKPTGPQMTAPVSQSDLRPDWMNPYGVYRKYTRQDEDWSDFDELREGLVLPPGSYELKRFMFDNLDLAEVTNYMAASALMLHCDRCEKNYYMYRDSEGDREWSILPWDMELALERWKIDNPRYNSLDFGDYNDHSWLDWDYGPGNPHTGLYIDSYNRLYDAILRMPETREMYLRRLRTLMDTILEPAPGYLERRVDYFSDLAGGSGASVRYGLSQRRAQLFGHPEIPAQQVGSPSILFGAVEYAPASGLPDEQYVELQNPNPFAVDVSGWALAGSVDFTFAPGTVIGAGASLYVSPNLVSFRGRPTGPSGNQGLFVVGGYDGRLRRDGQWLWLLDADGGQIDSVFVGDEEVVINEVLANSDGGAGDWIELHNLTDQPVHVGGWWLSDLPWIPARWRIPDGTEIGAGGYLVFNERDHFGGAFGLDAGGEWAVLSDAGGGAVDMQAFGNADPGVTFGRHLSDDGVDFVALSAATMDAANADPLVGEVVINEVMYHPVDGEDEFVELHNVTGAAVKLHDPADPGRTWALDGAVQFSFPPGAEIPAGGYALVVDVDLTHPADEASFRDRYGIPAGVEIFSPYAGRLNNAGECLDLLRPGAGGSPVILVDRVWYDDAFPWPAAADGDGPSLERVRSDGYGNDSGNWLAAYVGGSPGSANVLDNTPPQVDAGQDRAVWLPSPALLDATVADDGRPVPPGALTATWSLVSGPGTVTFDDPHAVDAVARFSDPGTYVLGLAATDGQLSEHDEVTVTVGPALTAVASADVTSGLAGMTVSFTAQAAGGRPLPRAFVEHDGMVVIEAESFTGADGLNDVDGLVFQTGSDPAYAGYVGDGYLETPWLGGAYIPAWDSSCEVTYEIDFATAGTYTIWLRRLVGGPAEPGATNSCFLGLDDSQIDGIIDNSVESPGQWWWVNAASAYITAGRHRLNLRRREAGYLVDRILMTTGVGSPAGAGPAQSPDGAYAFSWDFGDQAISAEQNPSHTYDTYGVYEAELTVADSLRQVADTVTIVVGAVVGDANGDGTVGIADLVALADNYGESGAWRDGDFNGDGSVGIADLAALADNYGRDVTGGERSADLLVPQPDGRALQPAACSVAGPEPLVVPAPQVPLAAAVGGRPPSAVPTGDPDSRVLPADGWPDGEPAELGDLVDLLAGADLSALPMALI